MVVPQGREVAVAARLDNISIVVPVLNEASSLEGFLRPLYESCAKDCEILVVDGGSEDNSVQIAEKYSHKVITSPAGRARQMNAGAEYATGSILLFLHADTVLPEDFQNLIINEMQKKNKSWGRFDVSLSGKQFMFRVIENLMNFRSSVTGIATGDQAIFLRKSLFESVGGFSDMPLMEDIEFCEKLKQKESPLCLKQRVLTSSRRWEEYGIWRTIILMWQLRLAYFLGKDPVLLKRKYQ